MISSTKKETWYTASQPVFFPPVYMLERFARVDVLVFLEEAQYTRKTGQSWTTLGNANGTFRFSYPVHGARAPTCAITPALEPENWLHRSRRMFRLTYGKCDGFRELREELDALLARVARSDSLNDAGRLTMTWLMSQAGIATKLVPSRSLVPDRPDDATEWMAAFAPCVEATDYVQGESAMKSYFRQGPFERAGVGLWCQDYTPPQMDQPMPFPVTISGLDPLLRYGRQYLRDLVLAALGTGDVGTVKKWNYGDQAAGSGG